MTSATRTSSHNLQHHDIPRPSRDPFYATVLAEAAPGEIVRIREVDITTRTPTRAWQVVHGSTTTTGHRKAISGTVLVPTTVWAAPSPRPLVSYGVGVHGLSRDSAPSFLLASGAEPELPVIERALRRGWAVAVTDGQGLGMPGPHTYGAADDGAHAMLDAARAAIAVAPDLRLDSPLVLWGYSEGGRYTARAAETQPDYAPEINLVAAAAGGVPSDLSALAASLDRGPFRGLALAVLIGLAHAHQDPRLWTILNELGTAAAARAVDLDATGLIRNPPRSLTELTVRGQPWDDPAWAVILQLERLEQVTPRVPVLLYHAQVDEIIPATVARELFATYLRFDADVTWVQTPAPNHTVAGYRAALEVTAWLGKRIAEAAVGRSDGRPRGD